MNIRFRRIIFGNVSFSPPPTGATLTYQGQSLTYGGALITYTPPA